MSNTILLVDDEKDILIALKELLEMEGYVVLSALNGQIGFQVFKEYRPDLIITDMMMPVMNGYEMIKLIRQDKDHPRVPIIVMSSAVSISKTTNPEWDYFIKKPGGIDNILIVIRMLVCK